MRHDRAKDVLAEMGKAARLCFEEEAGQVLKGNTLRPDIPIQIGKDGYDLAMDITIVNPTSFENSILSTCS